jgi:hypothetical protein
MKFKPSVRSIAVVAIAGLLAACGGGDNKSSSGSNATVSVAQLNGTFVFSANGNDPADGSYFVAGSFTADGKGGLAGIEDLNLGSGVDSNVPFTGTYQVDSAGSVAATISDGTGVPTFFTFPMPSGAASVKVNYDGTGTGTVQAQTTSGFTNVGTFAFTLNGQGEGTVTGSGSFTTNAAGSFTTGSENFSDGAFARNTSALSGTLSPAFSGGRGTAVIGTDMFSYYAVSQNQIVLAGLEDTTLIYGTATKQ